VQELPWDLALCYLTKFGDNTIGTFLGWLKLMLAGQLLPGHPVAGVAAAIFITLKVRKTVVLLQPDCRLLLSSLEHLGSLSRDDAEQHRNTPRLVELDYRSACCVASAGVHLQGTSFITDALARCLIDLHLIRVFSDFPLLYAQLQAAPENDRSSFKLSYYAMQSKHRSSGWNKSEAILQVNHLRIISRVPFFFWQYEERTIR
jgi:hypothetical protein